jgi:hypothetical protein
MSKPFFLLFVVVSFSAVTNAQKGNNNLNIRGEATFPIFQNETGFGFYLKGLYGMGKSAQLTLSAGVSKFNSKNSVETGKTTTRLVPFLFGYKQNIQRFFIEPRIGIGELGGKQSINGDYARQSVAAMFGGIDAGYKINRLNLGINFVTAHGIENASAGSWHDKNFHYTSVFVGYDLFPKAKY